MSRTQDMCDAVATLEAAVRRYEEIAQGTGDLADAWRQVRRAVGYVRTAAMWKEDMSAAEILAQGVVDDHLDESWDMDNTDPWA